MRFHGILPALLGDTSAARVLNVVLRHPAKEFTGREVARAAGIAPSKTNARLRRLLDEGLVERRGAGRASLWRLSRKHVLVAPLRQALAVDDVARRALVKTLRAGFEGCEVDELKLFGSVARGTERPDSDVDLLVLVPNAQQKTRVEGRLPALRADVHDRFGNALSVSLYTRREWARLVGDPLRESVERDARSLEEWA